MTPVLLLLLAAGDVPHLDWDRDVQCLMLPPTKAVPSGLFRAQCDHEQKRCLLAPTRVLIDGVEGSEELSRTKYSCRELAVPADDLVRRGYRFEDAIAEAPPGWYRDERGRVMQVNFDLHRRFLFGGAWAPYGRLDGVGFVPGRARVELGGEATVLSEDGRLMHRFHWLEATGWLGGDLLNARFEASVLRYDTTSRSQRAPLWVTTFIGQPHRFDVPLRIGWAAEAGRFEALGGRTFVTFAEADATVELWSSDDLDSYLRLRLGPALEYDIEGKGAYLRPAVALEGDFTLDRDGFHHVTASVTGEKLFFEPADPGRVVSPNRLRIKAGYELILFAINDYPLTLVVDGRATYRDDVPLLRGWEFQGNAGLRFSLWAPARHKSTQVSQLRWGNVPIAAPVPANEPMVRPDDAEAPPKESTPPAVEPAPSPSPSQEPPSSAAPPVTTPPDDGLTDTERLIRAAKKKLKR
ncbi:MAG: hypothetical protein U0228_14345 [Myxococcaceae bacterium]